MIDTSQEVIRLTKTLKAKGLLVTESEVKTLIDTQNPWFQSLYYYDVDVIEHYKQNKTVTGFNKVWTNKLVFDLDCSNLETSRVNVVKMLDCLKAYGLYKPGAVKVSFSGSKGFHLVVNTDFRFTPKQLKSLCLFLGTKANFSKAYKFKLDPSIYNPNRIFRITNTLNEKSNLYKVDITEGELYEYSIETILEMAESTQPVIALTSSIEEDKIQVVLKNVPQESEEFPLQETGDSKPTQCNIEDRPCILALQEGDMDEGESNSGLLRLANFYRDNGLTKEECFLKLQNAALARKAKYPNTNPISNAKIRQEVLNSVYRGGYTFTCNDSFLRSKCRNCKNIINIPEIKKEVPRITELIRPSQRIQIDPKERPKPPSRLPLTGFRAKIDPILKEGPVEKPALPAKFRSMKDTAESFEQFAKDVRTRRVETGIVELDKVMNIIPNGLTVINAMAGVGKTTIALNMMLNASKKGLKVLFYCIDMAEDEFYSKIKSKVLEISPDDVYDLYLNSTQEFKSLREEGESVIQEAMANVMISYEAFVDAYAIERDIKQILESGEKVDVIIIDYLQKLTGCHDYGKGSEQLQYLKKIIHKYKVPIIGLSQIPRGGGRDESTPIRTAAAAQGGAVYEQNASIVINLWRPLKFVEGKDKAMGYMIAKNRMGQCKEGTLFFDGRISKIETLTDEQRQELEIAIQMEEEKKKAKKRANFRG